MSGVTLKVSPATRDRVRQLAKRSHRSMHSVIEEALDMYEQAMRVGEYLEGWRRYQKEDPMGFAGYVAESLHLEGGLTDPLYD